MYALKFQIRNVPFKNIDEDLGEAMKSGIQYFYRETLLGK